MHEVRLAEADPAVEEERVVGVARSLGDRQGGGVGEPVRRPDDEIGERIARVEIRLPTFPADARRLETDGAGRAIRRTRRVVLRLLLGPERESGVEGKR